MRLLGEIGESDLHCFRQTGGMRFHFPGVDSGGFLDLYAVLLFTNFLFKARSLFQAISSLEQSDLSLCSSQDVEPCRNPLF